MTESPQTQATQATEARAILLADTAPVLCPMQHRTPGPPGTHLSEIIRSLCLRLGHYDEESEVNWADLELGAAIEFAVIHRLKADDPRAYFLPGELELDGVYGHADLAAHETALYPLVCVEIKGTSLSTQRGPGSTQFWRFEVQSKGYCKMLQHALELGYPPPSELHVVHYRGDYKLNKRSCWKRWLYPWSQYELDANWDKLLQHREIMRQDQAAVERLQRQMGGQQQ